VNDFDKSQFGLVRHTQKYCDLTFESREAEKSISAEAPKGG
jgi:hypothetical protein